MIIQTENLHKTYGRHGALRGLNLAVPEGSAYALIGANGAGKTTTIKTLMNIITPSAGTARILGVDSRALSPAELARIGYVSENQEMPAYMTVGAYLDYLRPFYPGWDGALEAELLGRLHLPVERRIGHLSHGMRMKMALLCALAFRPRVLILDEPFSGLDPLVRDELAESLLAQAGEMTILVSSHELSEIEGFATDVGFIDEGRMLFQEPLEDLQARLRAVRVVLDRDAALPAQPPQTWLDVRAQGSVLSFVDTHYAESALQARVAALLPGVQRIETEPVALRTMFTTLARAMRDGRTA
jgi:ABC-2 type transport system ATP-binding protein